jgi:hypothetical protein
MRENSLISEHWRQKWKPRTNQGILTQDGKQISSKRNETQKSDSWRLERVDYKELSLVLAAGDLKKADEETEKLYSKYLVENKRVGSIQKISKSFLTKIYVKSTNFG